MKTKTHKEKNWTRNFWTLEIALTQHAYIMYRVCTLASVMQITLLITLVQLNTHEPLFLRFFTSDFSI